MEFLSEFDCRSVVNAESFKRILEEIAIQEVIQKPGFIRECWSTVLENVMTPDNLQSIYKAYKPTSKNINNCLVFTTPLNDNERKVCQYIRNFVGENDEKTRMAFLKYCTGSNVLVPNKKRVSFNDDVN